MPLVSLTRLRLRSWRFLPAFALHTWRSARQLAHSDGFIGGALARDDDGGFWTLTLWSDLQSMRAYRNSGNHMRAMPKLIHWCDEAAVAHWEQPTRTLPDAAEALRRMRADGRLSKVGHPTTAHAAGDTAPTVDPPKVLRAL